MGRCKTVKIVADSKSGYSIMNESDFVEGEHELFEEPEALKEGSVPWLKAELTAKDIAFTDDDKKPDLEKLLKGAE